MGRSTIYYDYKPVNIYPVDNQVPELVNQHEAHTADVPLYPNHIALGARPDQGPFTSAGVQIDYPNNRLYRLLNQARGFYPLANTWLFITPKSPIRYDTYNQGVQPPRGPGKQKSGTAPNMGIYTGRYELESYSYYGGSQEEEY